VTQEERLLARLRTLDASALYEIIVFVTAEKTIGFWIVKKQAEKVEGEQRRDILPVERMAVNA
jgi:hypothetical protein